MIPRNESIFNIGEEETSTKESNNISSRLTIRGAAESLVGLRILIESNCQGSNIVSKSSLKLGRSAFPRNLPELGFLKACFFCKKELSLDKDVFMYRGDKGFCSVECRYREILLDEKRELETKMREHQRVYHHHHHHHLHRHHTMSKARDYDRRKRRITIGAS